MQDIQKIYQTTEVMYAIKTNIALKFYFWDNVGH